MQLKHNIALFSLRTCRVFLQLRAFHKLIRKPPSRTSRNGEPTRENPRRVRAARFWSGISEAVSDGDGFHGRNNPLPKLPIASQTHGGSAEHGAGRRRRDVPLPDMQQGFQAKRQGQIYGRTAISKRIAGSHRLKCERCP